MFNALKCKRSPFIGVIVNRRSRMSLVSRMEGPVGPGELLVQLAELFAENEAELVVARRDREERTETQMIRRQQVFISLNIINQFIKLFFKLIYQIDF